MGCRFRSVASSAKGRGVWVPAWTGCIRIGPSIVCGLQEAGNEASGMVGGTYASSLSDWRFVPRITVRLENEGRPKRKSPLSHLGHAHGNEPMVESFFSSCILTGAVAD